jgi:hypothetical protein
MLSASNPMRKVLLCVLIFEVIVFGLAIPVMIFVSAVATGLAVAAGCLAGLLALVSAALMRRPIGMVLGWVTQVGGLALGLVTSSMFVAGGIFAGLWLLSFVLGRNLDAARPGPRTASR